MLKTLQAKQFIKSDLATVWGFFSSPKNLAKITPPYMGFEVLSLPQEEHMYAGQIIEYYVRPVLGIKMHWVTEITHVKENEFFVDEQRFGPYKFWHHKHFFKEVPGGVEMTDVVHYQAGFGVFGKLATALFIEKKIKEIFDFRFKKVEEIFNS